MSPKKPNDAPAMVHTDYDYDERGVQTIIYTYASLYEHSTQYPWLMVDLKYTKVNVAFGPYDNLQSDFFKKRFWSAD